MTSRKFSRIGFLFDFAFWDCFLFFRLTCLWDFRFVKSVRMSVMSMIMSKGMSHELVWDSNVCGMVGNVGRIWEDNRMSYPRVM